MASYDDTATEALVLDDAGYTATQKTFPEENILLRYRMDQRSGDWVYPESTAKDLANYGGAGTLALRMSGGTNGLTTWAEGTAAVGEFHASIATNWTTSSYTLGLTGSVLNCSGFSSIYHRQQELFDAYAPASFSMWVKGDWDSLFARSTGANTPVVLFHHGAISLTTGLANGTTYSRFALAVYNNTLVLSYVYTTSPASAGTIYTISTSQAASGLHSGWNNIVAVFAPSVVHLYVNGVEVGALTHSPSRYFLSPTTTAYGFSCGVGTSYSSPAAIGVFPATGFVGALDEVVVWNKALTPAEVRGVYSSPNYEPYLYAGVSVDSTATYGAQDVVALVESLLAGEAATGAYSAALSSSLEVSPGIGFVHGSEASEIIYAWLSDRVDTLPALSALYLFFQQASEIVGVSPSTLDQHQLHDLVSELLNAYEGLSFTDAPAANEVISVAETIAAGGSLYNLAGAESLSVAARLLGAWIAILLESIELDAVPEWRVEYLLSLVERLAVTGSLTSQLEAEVLASTALAFSELTLGGKGADAEDEISALAVLLDRVLANNALIETATLLGTTTLEGRLVFSVSDVVISAGVPTSTALVQEALEAGVAFAVNFGIGGQTYSGWVMNTKNFAVSEYQDYPFNSFCYAHGKYLGANENGIYELTGGTDAGEDIQATLRLGVTDFNLPNRKIIDSVYLGFRADGTMLLKTIADDHTELLYEVDKTEGRLHRRRIHPMAKGLKAVYWQFELANVNGSDFELSEVEFFPVIMKRTV